MQKVTQILSTVGCIAFGIAIVSTSTFAASSTLISEPFSQPSDSSNFQTSGAGSWQVLDGSYQLLNPNVASDSTPGNTNLATHKTTVNATEWQLNTDALINSGSSSVDFSIIFNFVNPTNYSFVNFSSKQGTNSNGVFAIVNGSQTKLASLPSTFLAGKVYPIELRKKDDSIKVYNGTTYLTKATIPSNLTGKIGFGSRGGSVVFDNLVVQGEGTIPVITPSPIPTNTPVPTSTPAPTATPVPTATPKPTATPAPTSTPVPTATPSATPQPTATPTPTSQPTTTPTPTDGRTVNVSNTAELMAAMLDAREGDTIHLADGIYLNKKGMKSPIAVSGKFYTGTFTATASGSASRPITLEGSPNAVIDGGSPGGQYGLYLVKSDYWIVRGITITDVSKGFVLDSCNHALVDNVEIYNVGDEGIHFRSKSSDNILQNSYIHDTGVKNENYGEGIYVGSANSNWGTYSDGVPDTSDRNQILNNTVERTGAESIDIKEGTSNGIIKGNRFDGTGMTGNFADSWIDMKGNNWLITENSGINSINDGYQVHGNQLKTNGNWGNNNTFTKNIANVNGPGYGFWSQNNVTGNIFSLNNTVMNAASGFANVAPSP